MTIAALALGAPLSLGHATEADTLAPPAACSPERLQQALGQAVTVDAATKVAASSSLPAHCAVTGHIEHGGQIGFALGLPDQWNRKFLFIGVGGFAGNPGPLDLGLARGYATASTDTGHADSSKDAKWALNNPAAVRNHFEVAVEITAVAMKQATSAYYRAVPVHAYWDGCSGGGRQGLIEAQRFPDAFDGVIAGAPAWNYTKLFMGFVENTNLVLRSPENWIRPDLFLAIDREVLRQCDKVDGLADGIVMNPRACKIDLRKLLCSPKSDASSCLSPAQLGVIEQLRRPDYARPGSGFHGFHLTGTDARDLGWSYWFFGPQPPQAQLGVPFEGPNAGRLGTEFVRYMVMNDPRYDWTKFTIAKDAQTVERALGDLANADDTDMSPFFRRGGKLLIWHGWADPAIPPGMSVDLYDRIQRDTKGPLAEPIGSSVRLFMVPGVQHCHLGSGLTEFDRLSALEAWVERGEAPERIVATQLVGGRPARTRPLCAYPKVARYRGKGDPDAAESFECR